VTYAWIMAGAVVGAPLRYFIGSRIHNADWWSFPAGTFLINVTGCLLIGFILGVSEHRSMISRETRLLLVTGFLGSYTTFSSFGWETYDLGRSGDMFRAITYAVASVILGIIAVWLGASASKLT
jgi:CrcB protein